MTTHQKQLELFGRKCWGKADLVWQVLEREEREMNTEEALEYIEGYTGKLPETMMIPVQVLYLPGSNFFLMPILEEVEADDEEPN
ncbi:MAG: hypothetical protein EHM30_00025 [Desulfobacteraceae bacterium]|nr:MAG: hypothetical protein EHM30_00025 [Desulfobacteraceae bacterium]